MSSTACASLVEAPRESLAALAQCIPDTPWTTTSLQALQNRRAAAYVDDPRQPRSVAVFVKGGDGQGDHDQAFVYGLPSSASLRNFVSSVDRTTEFVADAELAPMILELHPGATLREAVCCWFDRLDLPTSSPAVVPIRRLRVSDAEAAQALIPPWAFRTFESPKEMISSGGCFGVELNGRFVSIAYVADQSVKYARVAVVTAEGCRRKGYGFAAARRLMEHLVGDGRLVCALAPRPTAAAVRFALKFGFPQKALLRTYKVRPKPDSGPASSTSKAAHAQG